MSDEYVVDTWTLSESADGWTDQGSRLTTARDRLADAPTSGFTSAVAGQAATWTSSWSTVVGGVADRAEGIADQLRAAFTAYTTTDVAAQETFQQWMGNAP